MTRLNRIRCLHVIIATLVLSFLCTSPVGLRAGAVQANGVPPVVLDPDDGPKKERGSKKKSSKKRRPKKKKKKRPKKKIIRWGQKRNESDAKYDKRYGRLLKRVKRDKRGDYRGGIFENAEGDEIRLWTYMGHYGCPFIIRSDISKEFTANTAMYMEMLHREFSSAYKKLLGFPAQVKEPVEIIVFADRGTYIKAGGSAGSGGQFNYGAHFSNDRGQSWPARHYRMMQFTDGITDFAKWPKGVLKHESCHMELGLRVGYKTEPRLGGIGFPIIPPIWWNEGQATIFEWWDFEKTVDENFAEIPKRGRYAPFIRRIRDTDDWKDFDYYWTISRRRWGSERRVYLNYCESWSIVAYMFTGGTKGRNDFRKIFDLTKRVGTNDPDVSFADLRVDFSRAWAEVFPSEAQDEMAANWEKWVDENIPPDGRIPDEEFCLRRSGYDPSVTDRLEPYKTEEERKENREWVEREEERRRKAKTIER